MAVTTEKSDQITNVEATPTVLEDTTSLMDQAIFASQKGAGSFDDIANAIGLIAPMAATAGISFEELLGAMRTLRVGGLNAATATVSLQGVIRKIIMPTEEMKILIQKKMKKNCQVHKPSFCDNNNNKCMKTACWSWEAKSLARQIVKLIADKGVGDGMSKVP